MSSLLDLAEGRWHLFWPDPKRLLSRRQLEAAQYYNDEAQTARFEDDGGQPAPEGELRPHAYGPFMRGSYFLLHPIAVRR